MLKYCKWLENWQQIMHNEFNGSQDKSKIVILKACSTFLCFLLRGSLAQRGGLPLWPPSLRSLHNCTETVFPAAPPAPPTPSTKAAELPATGLGKAGGPWQGAPWPPTGPVVGSDPRSGLVSICASPELPSSSSARAPLTVTVCTPFKMLLSLHSGYIYKKRKYSSL